MRPPLFVGDAPPPNRAPLAFALGALLAALVAWAEWPEREACPECPAATVTVLPLPAPLPPAFDLRMGASGDMVLVPLREAPEVKVLPKRRRGRKGGDGLAEARR